MYPPLIFGPIPPYSNVPIEPQYYAPRRFEISGVTNGSTTLVTTIDNHDYVIGNLIRLLIPYGFGCTQLNNVLGYVISIPNLNQVIVDINSTNSNAYIASSFPQQPQIVAVGDINTGQINALGPSDIKTFIPGSFINISPL